MQKDLTFDSKFTIFAEHNKTYSITSRPSDIKITNTPITLSGRVETSTRV